ncbi:MAG: UDP-4-amino-4,6-dideoxy-N-acetyl-beta-L-altrosamine transaminase [Candidatus Electrothrix sp. Rat3]|nr:UDP-4-amino-4,6-dideoxy-N-acetyl-beta-L-altrosamine transaminase [Candidatus Electrothrix rattekaaiensis]
MIPYGWQDINQQDIDEVVAVLRSDWLTQGPKVPEFEQAVAMYCSAKYAVAVNSATSALHIACLALGLSEGDYLWTSPNTFIASANCALYCGASVDFVDIDPRTYNMSVAALEEKLISAEKQGKLPKVVVPVHFAGQSCEMATIKKLGGKYGFSILEDASHAIGGKYRDEPIGNCRFSDITVFSFHPVKIITTGEGGMALTNNSELAQRMARLRTHGITRDADLMTEEPHGPWYYQQIELGFNYRITDIQAALGVSQLQRLDEFILRRHEIAERYNAAFEHLQLIRPWQHSDCFSAYHLYVVRLQSQINKLRLNVFNQLRASEIGVNIHYIPIHTQPFYRKLGFKVTDFPEAEGYYQEAISLPMYPTLSANQQTQVIETLQAILS